LVYSCSHYYDKEIVERAFKQLKGILNLRQIRVWLREHIEGHIAICYLAYAIIAYMNYKLRKTEFTAVDALTSLKSGYKVSLSASNTEWDVYVPLEPKQNDILKAMGVVYKK
jgi:transposase